MMGKMMKIMRRAKTAQSRTVLKYLNLTLQFCDQICVNHAILAGD